MSVQISPGVKTVLILIITQTVVQHCMTFDLSTLLSKGPNFSLEQIKSLVSPETLQKFLESKGLLSPTETLRNGDPVQIQTILSRLKPMNGGRVDPRILELLTSSLGGTNDVPPIAPQPPPPSRAKFSSKFRRRRPGRTSPMPPPPSTASTERINENADGTLQFDKIDPNLRNHNLYGWINQNFTTIDRSEDLMMDETESIPALIPLSGDSEELQSASATKPGHWEHQNSKSTEPPESESHFTREQLGKATPESGPVEFHLDPIASSLPHFKPSPVDNRAPLRVSNPSSNGQSLVPNSDPEEMNYSFLNRIGQLPPNSRRPPVPRPPFYNSVVRHKQNRILNADPSDLHRWESDHPGRQVALSSLAVGVQNHGPPILSGLAVPVGPLQRIPEGQESKLNYQYAKPAHYPGNGYKGSWQHPFAHYKDRHSMYSPSHYHHNKYHYLNPSIEDEDQSPASDKIDGYWSSSTFFILGGIVAASALAAFVLPSLIPAATAAGKESEVANNAEGNNDFWNEVKGLYTDLTHLAKGDLSHFDQGLQQLQMKNKKDSVHYKYEPPHEIPIKQTTEKISWKGEEFKSHFSSTESEAQSTGNGGDRRKGIRRGSGRIENEDDETASLATPIFNQISSSGFSGPGSGSSFIGTQRPNNSSVMKEWIKLQLQVSE